MQYRRFTVTVGSAIDAGIDLLTIADQQVLEEGIGERTVDLIEGYVRSGQISGERIAANAARRGAARRGSSA